jgi:hypothetical protein
VTAPRVTTVHTLHLSHPTTVGELRDALETMPWDGTVRLSITPPDRPGIDSEVMALVVSS